MAYTSKDAGLIQVFAERLKTQLLPRVLSLKDQVDHGKTLSEFDIQFLEKVFRDAQQIFPLADRHPEWQDLVAKLCHLYKEITDKALENEKAKGGCS